MTAEKKTLSELMDTLGVLGTPGWFKNIRLEFWPQEHQMATLLQYPNNLRYGDFSDPGTGKTFPAHVHGVLMAALSTDNRVVYTMPPNLIEQFYEELLWTLKGIDKHLTIDHLKCSQAVRERKLDHWRTTGKWPSILIISYDFFRRLNSVDKVVNYSPNTLIEKKDGSYVTKNGDPVRIEQAKRGRTKIKGKLAYRARNPHYLELYKAGYNVYFFDEAHTNLMNTVNISWKTCDYMDRELGDDVALYYITGTPITRIEDSYGLVKLVNRDAYVNKTQFIRRHVVQDLNSPFFRVISYKNLDELSRNLYRNARRVEKRQVAKMHAPVVSVIPVTLQGAHKKLYQQYLSDHFAVIGDEVLSAENEQKLNQTAYQLLASPEKFDPAGADGRIAKDNELRKALDSLLETLNPDKRKVLIFAKYRSTVDALHTHLIKYNPAVLNGSTSDGATEVAKFQKDDTCRVFIANWISGGAGLNLQKACSDVVFYEQPSSPKDVEQGVARVDRTGQTEQVNVYFFNVKGTKAAQSLRNLVATARANNDVVKDEHQFIYSQIERFIKR